MSVVPAIERCDGAWWLDGESVSAIIDFSASTRMADIRSKKPRGIDWTLAVHVTPTPEKVAKIAASHGYLAACERWGWLGPRTISNMIREGKRRLRHSA